MQHIRLFNCRDHVECFRNEQGSSEIFGEIKKSAELYFNVSIVENITFPNICDPNFMALDKDGLPVVVLFKQDSNDQIFTRLEHYLEQQEGIQGDRENVEVLLLANYFHPFDVYLATQSKRRIKMIRYEVYSNDLLLFETIYPKNQLLEFADFLNSVRAEETFNQVEIQHEAKKIHINLNTNPPSVSFTDINKSKISENKNKNNEKPKVRNRVWGIGYCKIQKNRHYAIFPNNEKVEIIDLPEAIYMVEGQFVLVDPYGKFKYVFGSMMDDTYYNNAADCFALVVVRGDQTYIDKGDGVYRKFINETNISIRNQTIISLDRYNRFIRYYKPIKFVADSFMKSVKAKKHQMVFVLELESDEVLLRDIETGKEFRRKLNQDNKKLQKHHILCLDQDRFITAFSSSRFYTLSSYYKKLRYGTVEIEDENVYLNEFNGDRFMIKCSPANLENGSIVSVDELDQYCSSVVHEELQDADLGERSANNSENNKKKEKNTKREKIEIKGKALVLGNNTYANSYRLSLLKCGYYATVLEGYEPWAKIKNHMRAVDIIVVVTSHISHENMQRIKKEVDDIPVIYSEFDGANRVQTQILAKLEETALPENA